MRDTSFAVREVRLGAAYQYLYPEIQAGIWYIAASLVEVVGAQPGPPRPESDGSRVLSDLHFEFRGGEEPQARASDARTRREDA